MAAANRRHLVVFAHLLVLGFCGQAAAQAVSPAPGPAGFPPSTGILGVLQTQSQYSLLVQTVQAAGLTNTVVALSEQPGGITIFAPNNTAFEALGNETLTCLQAARGRTALIAVLTYHVVNGSHPIESLFNGAVLTSLSRLPLHINVTTAGATVQGVRILVPNQIIGNTGVVHEIERVLLPPGGAALIRQECSVAAAPSGSVAPAEGPTGATGSSPGVGVGSGSPTRRVPPPMPPPPRSAAGNMGLSLGAVCITASAAFGSVALALL